MGWEKLNYDRTFNVLGGGAQPPVGRVQECAGAIRTRPQAGDAAADIEAAGRRLKADGIDGSGTAALMADTGLTNGALYPHFDSKDDLVASAVADQKGPG